MIFTMRLIPLGGSIRRRLKDLLNDPEKLEKFPGIYIATPLLRFPADLIDWRQTDAFF